MLDLLLEKASSASPRCSACAALLSLPSRRLRSAATAAGMAHAMKMRMSRVLTTAQMTYLIPVLIGAGDSKSPWGMAGLAPPVLPRRSMRDVRAAAYFVLLNMCHFKSSLNTPVMQRTRRVRKQRGWYAHKRIRSQTVPRDVAPLGSALVWLACTQRGPKRGLLLVYSGRRSIPLRIAPLRYKSNEPPAKGHVAPPPSVKSTGCRKART